MKKPSPMMLLLLLAVAIPIMAAIRRPTKLSSPA